mmetsp:Transcript_124659/g.285567  ORF Transcript_124659/g.285567 Transcript_124659/m.285567 type:complete len:422 (+) Transcript_124659:444-1709(+)
MRQDSPLLAGVLVGLKCEEAVALPAPSTPSVTQEVVDGFATENGFDHFLVSAKTKHNVLASFKSLVRRTVFRQEGRMLPLPSAPLVRKQDNASQATVVDHNEPLIDIVQLSGVQYEASLSLPKPRSQIFSQGHWHRSVHIWLLDLYSGSVLMQLKCNGHPKTPNQWTPTANTEVHAREESLNACRRALREQIGMEVGEPRRVSSRTLAAVWNQNKLALFAARESCRVRVAIQSVNSFLEAVRNVDMHDNFPNNSLLVTSASSALSTCQELVDLAVNHLATGEVEGGGPEASQARQMALEAKNACVDSVIAIGNLVDQQAREDSTDILELIFSEQNRTVCGSNNLNENVDVYILPFSRAPKLAIDLMEDETKAVQYFYCREVVENLKKCLPDFMSVPDQYTERLGRALKKKLDQHDASIKES